MTELRINFTVFALASFLISQRLWVTEPATHSTWAADVTFVPGLYCYHYSTCVMPAHEALFQTRQCWERTCGQGPYVFDGHHIPVARNQ